MMFCTHCGAPRDDAATVCTNCNQPVQRFGAQAGVPNYLLPALLVTVLCCPAVGIVAIIYAAQVNSKLSLGDLAGAQDASRKAKLWCWIAGGTGALIGVAWAVLTAISFTRL